MHGKPVSNKSQLINSVESYRIDEPFEFSTVDSEQSSDVDDTVPLTPNHVLYGQMGGQFATESIETSDFHPRKGMVKSSISDFTDIHGEHG